jgi:hypothetical protein
MLVHLRFSALPRVDRNAGTWKPNLSNSCGEVHELDR